MSKLNLRVYNQIMANKKLNKKRELKVHNKILKDAQEFREQFSERLLKLVTSGFGLVSALAWNELIKEVIDKFIQPLFGKNSGIISLLIYALFVTFLAVFITYQLSKITKGKKIED